MAWRRARSQAQPAAELDQLLARALDLAALLHRPEVSEALLCAAEALARATGDSRRLDAVCLRLCTGPARRSVRRARG